MKAIETKSSVLIVDDEVVLARLYVRLLEEEGYEASLATTPEEAFAVLARRIPSLIFLDCKMPLLSGEEFLDILRERYPDLGTQSLIVGFSSFDPNMKVVERFKKITHRFERKPDDIDGFLRLVSELLSKPAKSEPS